MIATQSAVALNFSIYRTLKTAGAVPLRTLALPSGLSMAHWQNCQGMAHYHQPGHHALSVYLDGGEQTQHVRDGQVLRHGHAGAVCMMPADSESHWRIGAAFSFLHLYFDDITLRDTIARTWDREGRGVVLREAYQEKHDPLALSARLIATADWQEPALRVGLDHLAHWLLIQAARDYSDRLNVLPEVKGRLTPRHAARLHDFIEDHLDQTLTLEQLAAQVALSPYHFARLFRATFGHSPHAYITEQRLLKAHRLLKDTNDKIGVIALECGFGQHSQLSRLFKRHFGYAPSVLRSL
ncbi:helix-turn-helix domain-containing protein [Phytohalomonas tamaricis]|uniref:helix-turn-helix domain-containing protein n=1 Tax=Phytohalomonas tamaricis TaxID=2081032 RepID=UPI000D0BC167|nr:AraC family transcriptional regulator [Phytohalomonas tamaricis]